MYGAGISIETKYIGGFQELKGGEAGVTAGKYRASL